MTPVEVLKEETQHKLSHFKNKPSGGKMTFLLCATFFVNKAKYYKKVCLLLVSWFVIFCAYCACP